MKTKKKVVLVFDYVKIHYLKESANGIINAYWQTDSGKELWGAMFNAIPYGADFDIAKDVEYIIDFAYDAVPDIIKQNRSPEFNKYKPVNAAQLKESGQRLKDRIALYNADIVVPMGSSACKVITGVASIKTLRGRPTPINFGGDKDTWVLPTYSTDAVRVSMKFKPLQDTDLQLLMQYLVDGESTFISKDVAYETYTNKDFDKCIAFLDEAYTKGQDPVNALAWDLETNTLQAEYDGSKILTFSASWADATGHTIPVDHYEQPWTDEQRSAIMEKIFRIVTSDMYKVGANIQFDLRFVKFHAPRYLEMKNHLDIQAGYYIAVTQEELDDKGLKTLAYHYTDMGGYDEPLSEYKKLFVHVRKKLGLIYENEKRVAEWEEYLSEGIRVLPDVVIPDFMTERDIQVMTNKINELLRTQGANFVNEVDGEKFNYEWIPYRVLADYASGDVDATRRINARIFEEEISKYYKWVTLYTEHYPTLMNTLADIEHNGMQVNRERLIEIRDAFMVKKDEIYAQLSTNETVVELEALKERLYLKGLDEKMKKPAERDKRLYAYYTKYKNPEDRKLRITSPFDKGMVLYGLTGFVLEPTREYLKESAYNALKDGALNEIDVDWSHYKTGSENVEALMEKYPSFLLGSILIEYSKAEKLTTTYTQSILDRTDSDDVLHGQLVSIRTATSRLASRNPK